MVKPQSESVFHRFDWVFVVLATSLAGVFGLIVFGSVLLASQVFISSCPIRDLASENKEIIMTSLGYASYVVVVVFILLIGYCFVSCKDLSFSDHMYATKKDLAIAFSSLSKDINDLKKNIESANRERSNKLKDLACEIEKQCKTSEMILTKDGQYDEPLRVRRTVRKIQEFQRFSDNYLLNTFPPPPILTRF
ncbi:unnamed protein product [Arabis nemorensis]|uniref:DUF1664 domain-containing protein n=1 Tax=Arabis nemorensis TaxID=586526 RepID=A0A565AQN5_9BRAS|nr:unnamed protein product [Arabis nemorensis]